MTHTTKLNHAKYDDTIRWTGRDTQGLFRWIAYGKTYEDIWATTVNGDVNHGEAEEEYRLWKIGKSEDDFEDAETGEIDYDEMDNVIWNVTMTDEDYKDLIMKSRGNAYYQTFEYRSYYQEDWVGEDEAPVYRIAADADIDRWGNMAYPGLIITETELERLSEEWNTPVSELMSDLDRIN